MFASRFSTSVFARIFAPDSVAEEPSSIYPVTAENAFISPFVSRVILLSLPETAVTSKSSKAPESAISPGSILSLAFVFVS